MSTICPSPADMSSRENTSWTRSTPSVTWRSIWVIRAATSWSGPRAVLAWLTVSRMSNASKRGSRAVSVRPARTDLVAVGLDLLQYLDEPVPQRSVGLVEDKSLARTAVTQPWVGIPGYLDRRNDLVVRKSKDRVLSASVVEIQPVVASLAVRIDAEAVSVDADSGVVIEGSANLHDALVQQNRNRVEALAVSIPGTDLGRKWSTAGGFTRTAKLVLLNCLTTSPSYLSVPSKKPLVVDGTGELVAWMGEEVLGA